MTQFKGKLTWLGESETEDQQQQKLMDFLGANYRGQQPAVPGGKISFGIVFKGFDLEHTLYQGNFRQEGKYAVVVNRRFLVADGRASSVFIGYTPKKDGKLFLRVVYNNSKEVFNGEIPVPGTVIFGGTNGLKKEWHTTSDGKGFTETPQSPPPYHGGMTQGLGESQTEDQQQQKLVAFLESDAKIAPRPQFLGDVKWKGLGAVAWKDKANPDASVKTLQSWLNKMLDACGYYGIGVDGVVGPGTCGAIAMMGDLKNQGCASESLWASAPAVLYEVTTVCQGWTMPTKKGQTKPDKPTSNLEKSKYALPWGAPDPQASVIQGQINTALDAIDYYGIPVSGQLDAQTCGAMKLLQDKTGVNWLDAYGMNCQSYILPQPKGGGGGGKGGGGGGGPECGPGKPCPPGKECCQQGWTEGDFGGAQPGCVPGTCVNTCPDGYTRGPTGFCKPTVASGGSSSSGLGLLVLGASALGLAFFASKSELARIPQHPSKQKLQENKRSRRRR